MNQWIKHDGSSNCPEYSQALIEVETWASTGSIKELACNLEWKYVKFYRILEKDNE